MYKIYEWVLIMDHRIIEREGFKVIGKSIVVSKVSDNQLEEIPLFWKKNDENGTCDKLAQHASELGVMGVMFDYKEEEQEMEYMIAIESPVGSPSEFDQLELKEIDIPASTWAVFSGQHLSEIKETYEKIYGEWLPSSDYQHAFLPELETYDVDSETGEMKGYEIWIPVREK